ncbi:MAG: type VII secretion-associated protein [Mycobacterium sp.]
MSAHRAVIEAGPGTVRRLCCGTRESTPDAVAALEWIDDPVALVRGRPVALPVLLRTVLASLACPDQPGSVLVVHPTWWSAARVDLVAAAADPPAGAVVTRPRSELLATLVPAGRRRVIVEIAARLVAITDAETVAEPRTGPPAEVAAAVVRHVVRLAGEDPATVVIDRPAGIGGAAALAGLIVERLRSVRDDVGVELVDAGRMAALAKLTDPAPEAVVPASGTRGPRGWRVAVSVAAALLGAGALAVGVAGGHRAPADAVAPATPATFLVEGRVALEVPPGWPVRRVTGGPGSARVEVASPSDPQVVLHVTQSPSGGTLADAAEALGRALNDAGPPGVFVDFNPSGTSAGRPAVTYREVRDGHHVDWAVLVDGPVRIGIGCQHRPADAAALRQVCEQAVRSAHAVR